MAWTLLAPVCLAGVNPTFVQSDDQYLAAFTNLTSSQSLVMITVTDVTADVTKVGCITPSTLIHAIAVEREMHSERGATAAMAIALKAPAHHFEFRDHNALKALGFDKFDMNYADACRIIRSGMPAYEEDRTGHIRAGQP